MKRSMDRVLFGVFGGIAEHFNINPFWLRLIFALLLLAALFTFQIWWCLISVAAYFVVAVIMKRPDTS